jgi:tight adherence protein C
MNQIIQQMQNFLAERGAPDWLLHPGAWIAIVCGLVGVLLVAARSLRRAKGASPPAQAEPGRRLSDDLPGGVFGALTEPLAAQIPESDKERVEFAKLLRKAGMYSRTARASVYAYRFLLMAFPMLCAGLLAVTASEGAAWKYLAVGGFIAATLSIIPRLYVWYRSSVRLVEIGNGLADMLDMLSMCLSGGMSISSSLDHVAKNLTPYPALAEELQIMRRQAEVGSLRLALADWANRIDTPEVRQVATMLARGDSLGSSMSSSLLAQADQFRTARKQLATLRANRMPVFLTFPLLFCFAPAVLIVLMAPSIMQLSQFLNPNDENSPLADIELMSADEIAEQVQRLDQSIPGLPPPQNPSSSRGQPQRRSLQPPPRQPPRIPDAPGRDSVLQGR